MKTKFLVVALVIVALFGGAFGLLRPASVEAKPAPINCPEDYRVRPLLQRGSQGECVKALQRELNMVRNRTPGTPGYYDRLVVDGIYGEKTVQAVKKFQRHHTVRINGRDQKLVVDGKVGPKTWKALYQAIIS